jgi:hypothetical protein
MGSHATRVEIAGIASGSTFVVHSRLPLRPFLPFLCDLCVNEFHAGLWSADARML